MKKINNTILAFCLFYIASFLTQASAFDPKTHLENNLEKLLSKIHSHTYGQLTKHSTEPFPEPIDIIDAQAQFLANKHLLNIFHLKQNIDQKEIQDSDVQKTTNEIQEETLEKMHEVVDNNKDFSAIDELIENINKQLPQISILDDIEFIIPLAMKLALFNNSVDKNLSLQIANKQPLYKIVLDLFILKKKLLQEQLYLEHILKKGTQFNDKIITNYKRELYNALNKINAKLEKGIFQFIYLEIQKVNPKASDVKKEIAIANKYKNELYKKLAKLSDDLDNFEHQFNMFWGAFQGKRKSMSPETAQIEQQKIASLQNKLQELYRNIFELEFNYEFIKKFYEFILGIITTKDRRIKSPEFDTVFEQIYEFYNGLFKNKKAHEAYEILFTTQAMRKLHLNIPEKNNALDINHITHEDIKKAYNYARSKYTMGSDAWFNARNAFYILANRYERVIYDAFLHDYHVLQEKKWIENSKISPEGKIFLLKKGMVEKLKIDPKLKDKIQQDTDTVKGTLPKIDNDIKDELDKYNLRMQKISNGLSIALRDTQTAKAH